MSYYNHITAEEAKSLPKNISTDIGFTANPTDAQLQAVLDALANYDNWEETTKAFIKLMVKELNILRGLHGLAPRTREQVITALKAEMEE